MQAYTNYGMPGTAPPGVVRVVDVIAWDGGDTCLVKDGDVAGEIRIRHLHPNARYVGTWNCIDASILPSLASDSAKKESEALARRRSAWQDYLGLQITNLELGA
jgi:hypothetical protein